MHIAIDARIINSSTGRYIERLLTYLEKLDSPHRYSVLVMKKDKDYWKPTKDNFTVIVADFQQYTFAEQLGFNTFLRKLKPDLVHFCMPQQPLLYNSPTVTTIHDLSLLRITENDDMSPLVLRFKQIILRGLLHQVIAQSKYIITPSQYTADDVMLFHNVPKDRIQVTYESADLVSKKKTAVPAYKDVPFLLMVGRTESYKNHRGAIQALQALLPKHKSLRLVIVGNRDASSYKLEEWVKENNYKNVDFFGFATDSELAWLYEHCQGYVFASFMEGFGLPGLEAMKHGAPVASSSRTSLPEVYGPAAVYFDPKDTDEMATVIGKLLDDSKLRKQLIAAGKKRTELYSWKRMAEQTLAIYDKALEK